MLSSPQEIITATILSCVSSTGELRLEKDGTQLQFQASIQAILIQVASFYKFIDNSKLWRHRWLAPRRGKIVEGKYQWLRIQNWLNLVPIDERQHCYIHCHCIGRLIEIVSPSMRCIANDIAWAAYPFLKATFYIRTESKWPILD